MTYWKIAAFLSTNGWNTVAFREDDDGYSALLIHAEKGRGLLQSETLLGLLQEARRLIAQ